MAPDGARRAATDRHTASTPHPGRLPFTDQIVTVNYRTVMIWSVDIIITDQIVTESRCNTA